MSSVISQRVELQSLNCIPIDLVREVKACFRIVNEDGTRGTESVVWNIDQHRGEIEQLYRVHGRVMMHWTGKHHSLCDRSRSLIYLIVRVTHEAYRKPC